MWNQQNHELDILTSYEPMLRRTVFNFMRRCSVQTMSAEDLMQEARLAFLQHIRTHRPEDYGRCHLTILHALCDAVLKHYPVSMPRGIFFDGSQRQRWVMETLNNEAHYMAQDGGFDAADLAAQIMEAVEQFHKEAMKLVKLKVVGYTNREAAQRLGMTDAKVSRLLKQIRRLLDEAA